MNNIREQLLSAWLKSALNIRGNRLVEGMSFNEISVCGILYRAKQAGIHITATEITEQTGMLKSQLNKVLNLLEGKGIIRRVRSDSDKRRVYISFCESGEQVYIDEHNKVLSIVGAVCDGLGEDNALKLAELLAKAADIVENISAQ